MMRGVHSTQKRLDQVIVFAQGYIAGVSEESADVCGHVFACLEALILPVEGRRERVLPQCVFQGLAFLMIANRNSTSETISGVVMKWV